MASIPVVSSTVVPQGTGYIGSFTLGPLAGSTGAVTGSVRWTFTTLPRALAFLAAGQTLVQSYNVTISDPLLARSVVQVVTVTLTATNDPTVIVAAAAAASVAIAERAGVTAGTVTYKASGSIDFSALALPDALPVSTVVPQGAGYLGSFTLGALADSTGGVDGSIPWT